MQKAPPSRECFLKNRSKLQMTIMVAEVGFEPTTSRLWASRAARLLYSAVCPPRDCRADIGGILGKERKRERFDLGIAFRLCLIPLYQDSFGIFGGFAFSQKFIVLSARIAFIDFPNGKRHLLPTQAINIPQRQNHAHLCILNAIYVPI